MPEREAVLQTVTWKGGKIRLIDQTALPERLTHIELSDWREVAQAIRTISLFADGEAVYNVGGGVVFDSTADEEYRECLLKARFATGTVQTSS